MHDKKWSIMLALCVGLAACGERVAEEAYDAEAPPPPSEPGLDAAATSGPSVTVTPDTAAAPGGQR